ncbi:deoxycytidylate deaminase [Vibrio anguillarum]|uniref:deoxycytidylate deaminase n=1 Tax=Vibrio anguillarum TaxID=55601 RepID=UPI001C9CEA2E|nr:deoxycytidylate deaminase [Vibrio anguillarum]MBY7667285.1 deoxycytidylate deaminase [Vibrio anguillarum]
MSSYLQSAIEEIYSEGKDFIVLGLTGRTGSGCSTLASILTSEDYDIKNSLFSGTSPQSNEDRKQKIILKHFNSRWEKFTLLQVRSLITILISQSDLPDNAENTRNIYGISEQDFEHLKSLLNDIKITHEKVVESVSGDSCNKDSCNRLLDYYTRILPSKCNDLKTTLGESNFVKLYQFVGKNLRTSGCVFDVKSSSGNSFKIAEIINDSIKLIRKANKELNKNTLIVVDAIRNPFEALFFQERYSSFYLVAVSCPDLQRKERLRKLGYNDDDICLLDEQENKSRDVADEKAYSIQDIPSCIERADVYIHNFNEDDKVAEFKNLANQIIKFVTLMKRPGIVTPTAVERCMQLAYTAKLNSGCISRQVGAAITDSHFSIRAIGWNDAPYGQVPCNLRSRFDLINGNDIGAYSDFEKKDESFIFHMKDKSKSFAKINQTMNISYCFKSEYNDLTKIKNQVHTRSLHAEENAFLQITKYGGQGIENGYLFTTASPCELCSKKAYQLGIKKIYYIDPYPGIAIDHILHGGSNNPELILFSGAIGKAFHRLYMPVAAYKDELNALKDYN